MSESRLVKGHWRILANGKRIWVTSYGVREVTDRKEGKK